MANKGKINNKIRRPKLDGNNAIVDRLERMSVGFLYAATELSQNDIAKIMGMGDSRVNEILKGIKKLKIK